MTLLAPEPPPQAAEAMQSTFHSFAERGAFRSPALRNATGPLRLAEPQQIFTLGLDDLVAGRGLEAAKPAGWRYLVQEGDHALAAAETVTTGPAGDHVFAAFNEGRFVASNAEALRTARALPELERGRFEVRLLRVPALYVTALWIHESEGVGDLLVPLAPSPVDAPAGRPIAAGRLLEELAAKARQAAPVGPADRSGG